MQGAINKRMEQAQQGQHVLHAFHFVAARPIPVPRHTFVLAPRHRYSATRLLCQAAWVLPVQRDRESPRQMVASLRAPACGTHIGMPRQQLAVRAAAGTPVAHPHPRLRRRTGAAAVAPPVTAAQKKVFTSFTDMIGQSSEPVLVEFYATWCG